MISANELRIGNLVLHASQKTPIVIDGKSIQLLAEASTLALPIPLTEEWLIKFGFDKLEKQSGGYQGYEKGQIELNGNQISDGVVRLDFENYMTTIDSVEIKYVHELQNLYFALTKTELL